MIRYTVKILFVLGLAVLVYFVGIPGCSMDLQYAMVEDLGCEDLPTDNCVSSVNPYTGPEQPDRSRPRDSEKPDRSKPRDSEKPNRSKPRTKSTPKPPARDVKKTIYDISLGNVDILFVIDNSSSMAIEHRDLAKQFGQFLNQIKNWDYHIAVITTDISSSPDNPVRDKYYQDGRFIPIGDLIFLRNKNIGSRPSQSTINAFKQAIERDETKKCDPKDQSQNSGGKRDHLYEEDSSVACPSSDERGIYAINEAIRNPQHRGFWRRDAHLIIVILSDEDVRSGEKYYNQRGYERFRPEPKDTPEYLVDNLYGFFSKMRKAKSKTFSVHSIIIPPGDSGCMNEQEKFRAGGQGRGKGYYGREYARLSRAEVGHLGNLLKGNVISICSRNYGSQLRRVAVSAETIRVPLPCAKPISYGLFVDGKKSRSSHKIEGRTLIMEPRSVKLDSKIHVEISCYVN